MWIRKNKMTRKIIALLLLVCIVSMGMIPMSSHATGTGEITLNNTPATSGITLDGRTFNLYQVLSWDSAKSTYEVNNDFQAFFTNAMTDSGLSSTDIDDVVTFIQGYELKMEEFTALLQAYVESNESTYRLKTLIASGESVVFDTLDDGYYFILDQQLTTGSPSVVRAAGAIDLISDGNRTLEITVKGSAPTITKENKDDNTGDWGNVWGYEIGDTINYKLVSTIPQDITGYEDYYYVISDTFSTGLSFVSGSIKVYTDSGLSKVLDSKYYTVSAPGVGSATFSIKVDINQMHTDFTAVSLPTELYITYDAVLTEDAEVVGVDTSNPQNPNTVTLTYSSNPYNEVTTPGGGDDLTITGGDSNDVSDIVHHYTFSIEVDKDDESGDPLEGAEFALYDTDTGDQLYLEKDGTGNYYIDPLKNSSASDTAGSTTNKGTIVTDTSGVFDIIGLNDDVSYTLKEINAPSGYNLMSDVIEFEIDASYSTTDGTLSSVTLASGSMSGVTVGGDDQLKVKVENSKTPLLPSTGGIGAVLFQVIGVLMMGGAVALLAHVYQKRKAS